MQAPHIVDSTRSFIDDHQKAILAVSVFEEGSDMSLSPSGEYLFFVITVREDQCSAGLEALPQ